MLHVRHVEVAAVPVVVDDGRRAGSGLVPSPLPGHTHELYLDQLRRWFEWCQTNDLNPLTGIQRAHDELYIRHLGKADLTASSINAMMHGVRATSDSPSAILQGPSTYENHPAVGIHNVTPTRHMRGRHSVHHPSRSERF
jgi:hypothetical protein